VLLQDLLVDADRERFLLVAAIEDADGAVLTACGPGSFRTKSPSGLCWVGPTELVVPLTPFTWATDVGVKSVPLPV